MDFLLLKQDCMLVSSFVYLLDSFAGGVYVLVLYHGRCILVVSFFFFSKGGNVI